MTFTKERIEQFINNPLEHGLTRSEQMEMARQLLAGMEQEPVGITDRSEIEGLKRGEMANVMPSDFKGVDAGDEVLLYAAPQLPQPDSKSLAAVEMLEIKGYKWKEEQFWRPPVAYITRKQAAEPDEPIGCFFVSDGKLSGVFDYIKPGCWPINNGSLDVYTSPQMMRPGAVVPNEKHWRCLLEENKGMSPNEAIIRADSWNACRAAMLHSFGNSEQLDKVGSWNNHMNTPTAQAGNSPVTPDTWIPVSERMPEVGVKVLCFPVEDEPIHAVFNGQLWLQDISWSNSDEPIDNAITCNVTHWMPLPAAPQQEVK